MKKATRKALMKSIVQSKLYTIWVIQSNGEGAIHLDEYRAKSPEKAKVKALKRVAADWKCEDHSNMHIYGVVEGSINMLEWNDLP